MSNEKAVAKFLEKKAIIDNAIARLQALSEDHFEVSPDEIHWGHVGDLEAYAEDLVKITDRAFNEGEFAE